MDAQNIKDANYPTKKMQQYIGDTDTLMSQGKTDAAIGQLLEVVASLVNKVSDLESKQD